MTRADLRVVARFIPDCVVLFRRLLGDRRVPWSRKALLAGGIAYLAVPFDLVPDFIPVLGLLDDALVIALVLRGVLRGPGAGLLDEHWPGPEASRRVIERLASVG